jgi:hypothetical protein
MNKCAERRMIIQECNTLISADEDGQGSTSRQEDLASVIIRKQRYVTAACLASTRLWRRSVYHPVTQVRPPGRVMFDTSRL